MSTYGPPAPTDAPGVSLAEPLFDSRERIVRPVKRRVRVRDLPRHAAVIRVLAARDFKVKYKQSILGPIWVVLQPLGLLLAFLVAFRGLGNVSSSNIPYAVFALSGLCAWSFFQAAMTIGAASMISNVNLVRYTPCPRVAPLASGVFSSFPSFLITGAGAIIGAAATGHLSIRVLLVPVALVWLLVLTFGSVAFFASLAVRYRDVISALPFLMQLGTFLVPIGYSLTALHSQILRDVVQLSPVTGLIETMRWMILAGYRPDVTAVIVGLAGTAVTAFVGWRTFTRRETTMADVI